MEETTELERKVLKNLDRRRLFGAKHISIDNAARSGFPSHERGNVKKAIENLIRKGLVQYYDKGRKAIQLNKERNDEIERIIRGY